MNRPQICPLAAEVRRRGWQVLLAVYLSLAVHSANAQCASGLCRPEAPPHPAVARIVNVLPGNGACYGSGTLVGSEQGKGLVLTCQHLFREGSAQITVCFPGGASAAATLLSANATWDLAALEISLPTAMPVAISQQAPREGEPLRSCGFGPDGRYRCNSGRALGYCRTGATSGYETLTLSGSARQGDSGGPVLNDRGELVAVIWGTDGRTVEATYCGRIRKFLATIGWRATSPVVPPPLQPIQPSDEKPTVTDPPASAPAVTDADGQRLRELIREIAVGLLVERAPGLVETFLPGLLAALGWTGPPSIAAIVALRLVSMLLKRHKAATVGRAQETASDDDESGSDADRDQRSRLYDDYAAQLAQVYTLSGHSTLADATLGRGYDEELRQAEQSSDATLARWARLLRERVAQRFFRIHGDRPTPAEPVRDK